MALADDCQTKHFHDSEEKYFTPDIEDICIGYELEMNWNRAYEERWVSIKILIQNEEFVYTDELSEIINALDDGMSEARVPYLTKEQLEAEGWKLYTENNSKSTSWYFTKGKEEMIYDFVNRKVSFNSREMVCKDINTFRKICKLLEIQ